MLIGALLLFLALRGVIPFKMTLGFLKSFIFKTCLTEMDLRFSSLCWHLSGITSYLQTHRVMEIKLNMVTFKNE